MEHRLYIVMRNDMASLNAGKACAQAAHAANQFIKETIYPATKVHPTGAALIKIWASSANGFGTTIVLDGAGDQIERALQMATSNGYICGATIDPTYPVQDGKTTHYVNIMTCAYFFLGKAQAKEVLSEFPLMH